MLRISTTPSYRIAAARSSESGSRGRVGFPRNRSSTPYHDATAGQISQELAWRDIAADTRVHAVLVSMQLLIYRVILCARRREDCLPEIRNVVSSAPEHLESAAIMTRVCCVPAETARLEQRHLWRVQAGRTGCRNASTCSTSHAWPSSSASP